MPSAPAWTEAARQVFQDRIRLNTRYAFSTDQLSEAHLSGLFDQSPYCQQVVPLDAALVARLAAQPDSYLEIGSRLLLECLRLGLRPNWDAANPESSKLAQKLGLVLVEPYEAYYYRAQ